MPYREFRFENFKVIPENQIGYNAAIALNSRSDNLYLWGPCGVGKTHLAFAIARRHVEKGSFVEFVTPARLMRRVRRRDPDEEHQAIQRFVRTDVLVIDDLGMTHETNYARQVLQEILDGREFMYRAGLVITSKYSLDALAEKLNDDTIPSRLAGVCMVVQLGGSDHRLRRGKGPNADRADQPAASSAGSRLARRDCNVSY